MDDLCERFYLLYFFILSFLCGNEHVISGHFLCLEVMYLFVTTYKILCQRFFNIQSLKNV